MKTYIQQVKEFINDDRKVAEMLSKILKKQNKQCRRISEEELKGIADADALLKKQNG
jgi:hypothetical protein